MCCICVLIGDFPGIDIVLPRTGSLGARGVGPGGVGTAAPTLSNTRAYPQSPYGYMYLPRTLVWAQGGPWCLSDPTNRCDCRQSVDTIRLLLKVLRTVVIARCNIMYYRYVYVYFHAQE